MARSRRTPKTTSPLPETDFIDTIDMIDTQYMLPLSPKIVNAITHGAATNRSASGYLPTSSCQIAVLIPCYNEAATIGTVIRSFAAILPTARIYVYDNNSKDDTARIAVEAGAVVRVETRQGKGHVVRRMFRDVEADLYVLVDGDNTYDPRTAAHMIALALQGQYDVVNGTRIAIQSEKPYRRVHKMGNYVFTHLVLRLFGNRTSDILSGYKVLSRRFVKSFPVLSSGFEIETELTIHALDLSVPMTQIKTFYRERPRGSLSKLHTFRDGWRILRLIIVLLKQERPMLFFSLLSIALIALSIGLAIPIISDFLATHTVDRLPTAVLTVGIMLIAVLSMACGIILDTVTRGRREAKLLHYLSIPYAEWIPDSAAPSQPLENAQRAP